MRKIFISSGHSNKPGRDMGASSGPNIEGVLSVEFRKMLVQELNKLGISPIVDSDNTILSESINFFKNITSPDSIVLDIHFNSGPPTATGTETLIPGENTEVERRIANELSKCVSETLSIPMRGTLNGLKGVKTELDSHHGRLGWMRLRGENVLMEICFISNPYEMEKYHLKKLDLAKSVALCLSRWVGSNPPKPTTENTTYIVKSGDSLWKIANGFGTTVENLKSLNNLKSNTINVGQKLIIKK